MKAPLYRKAFLSLALVSFGLVTAVKAGNLRPPAEHPYYLHALSDLRTARWMIEHRPGDWQQTVDEMEAVKQIDAAIKEIKLASIEDHKDIDDHPPVDERPDHPGRLHAALDFLRKARKDVSQDEDNHFAEGLQDRAYRRIVNAINATKRAIHQ